MRVKATVLAILIMALGLATVQAQAYWFDIPAQPLGGALEDFADQADLQVVYLAEVVDGIESSGYSGEATVEEVLPALLEGSGLAWQFTNERTVSIAAPAADGEAPPADDSPADPKPDSEEESDDDAQQAAIEAALNRTRFEGEVTVTATRRETDVQSTAAAITAVSGDQLEELGKVDVAEFIGAVPGVTAMSQGVGVNRIIFRNVATSTQEAGSPTSATYFDDFPVSSVWERGVPDLRLVDIDRVEVLKGPQGTLFGRSAMGGIVRYISNKPSTERFSAGFNNYLSSTTDGGTNFGGHAFANVPISDSLAVRVVGYTYQNDGFIDNVELDVSDVNEEDTLGGRLALRWDATERLSLDLTYVNQETDGAFSRVTTTRDPGDLGVVGDEGPDIPFDVKARTMVAGTLGERDPDYEIVNMKLEYTLETLTATFLATRSNVDLGWVFDEREYVDVRSGTIPDLSSTRSGGRPSTETETDVMELRLVSSGESFLDWIVGLYYEDMEEVGFQLTKYLGPDQLMWGFLPLTDGAVMIDSEYENSSHEEALYGELGFNFSEDTRMLLGYRRSDVEYGTLSTKADGPFLAFTGAGELVGIPFDTQEDVNTYKLSLEHSFNEDMFGYALASSGYRRGGFNLPTAISEFSTYDSDTLWNYEVGLKTTWLDGLLRANVAVYYLDWDDIQLVVQDPATFARTTQNVGRAEVKGVELGVDYFVNDSLRFFVGGSPSDSQLKEDVPPSFDPVTGEPIYTGRAGDRLPGSATESFSVSVSWDHRLDSGLSLFANALHRYVGERYNDFNLDLDVALPAYQLTDLRFGVSHRNGWSAAVFADNIFDEAVIFLIDRQGSSFESVPTNRPRTVGLNFIYSFN